MVEVVEAGSAAAMTEHFLDDLIEPVAFVVAEVDGKRVAAVALEARDGYYTLRADFIAQAGAVMVLVRTADADEIAALEKLSSTREVFVADHAVGDDRNDPSSETIGVFSTIEKALAAAAPYETGGVRSVPLDATGAFSIWSRDGRRVFTYPPEGKG